MKERGTAGAGEPQITGVPRVHPHFKRTHGRGTGYDILFGRTRVRHSGIRPLTPRAMIDCSVVTDGAKPVFRRNGFQTVREAGSSLCVQYTSGPRETGW